MLSEFQRIRTWENMLAAETRSLYFGDLASRYTRQKQVIAGLSLFLSSAAAAAVFGRLPSYFAIVSSLIVATLSGYSIAVNLDGKILTMVKLHSAWNLIGQEYTKLW